MNFQQMYKDFQVWSFGGFSPSLALPVGDFRSITSSDNLAEFSQVLAFTVVSAAYIGIWSIATGRENHTSNLQSTHFSHLIIFKKRSILEDFVWVYIVLRQ